MPLLLSKAPYLAAATPRSPFCKAAMRTLASYGAIKAEDAPVDAAILALRDPHHARANSIGGPCRYAWCVPEKAAISGFELEMVRRFHADLTIGLRDEQIPVAVRFPQDDEIPRFLPWTEPLGVDRIVTRYFDAVADALLPEREIQTAIRKDTVAFLSWKISVASYVDGRIGGPELVEIARWIASSDMSSVAGELFSDLMEEVSYLKQDDGLTEIDIITCAFHAGLDAKILARMTYEYIDAYIDRFSEAPDCVRDWVARIPDPTQTTHLLNRLLNNVSKNLDDADRVLYRVNAIAALVAVATIPDSEKATLFKRILVMMASAVPHSKSEQTREQTLSAMATVISSTKSKKYGAELLEMVYDIPPRLKDPRTQALRLSRLARAFFTVGEPDRALAIYGKWLALITMTGKTKRKKIHNELVDWYIGSLPHTPPGNTAINLLDKLIETERQLYPREPQKQRTALKQITDAIESRGLKRLLTVRQV